MTIRTLFLYLIGNRQAILAIAADRRALWIGLLFVLSAGFAREYDARSVWHEPWFFLIPLGASLATSFVLFYVLHYPVRRHKKEGVLYPRYFFAYSRFLSLFWMTAPLAWLYAIPYERFLTPTAAAVANLITLGVVAAWRVGLMVRVTSVLMGFTTAEAFFRVLLFGNGLALLILLIPRFPLLAFMGGIVSLTDRGPLVSSIESYLLCSGFILFPILLLGLALAACLRGKPNPIWQGPLVSSDLSTSRGGGLWAMAAGSVAVWILVLPWTQPAIFLRIRIEQDLTNGRIAEGLAAMSEHSPADFPPAWDPPPNWSIMMESPPLLDVVDVIVDQPTAPWVRDLYLAKLRKYFQSHWAYSFPRATEIQKKMAKVFLHLPEGPALSVEFPHAVEFVLRHPHSDLTPKEREKLEAMAKQAERPKP